MKQTLHRLRGRRPYRGRYTPLEVIIPAGDYLDLKSRMDYIKQKMAAENRMRMFDEYDRTTRAVASSAGTMHNTAVLLRAGVRTFEQAEQAIAGVWDGND